jgi:hypothetical protein
MPRPKILSLFLASALSVAALAQQTKPIEPTVPDHVLFRFFFRHVVNMDRFSRKVGVDGVKQDLKDAGLTDGERSLLKEIAESEERELESFAKNIAVPAMAPIREKNAILHKNGQPLVESTPVGRDLDARQRRIIESHVDRLRTGMGPVRFKTLYDFIKKTEEPNIHTFHPGDKVTKKGNNIK